MKCLERFRSSGRGREKHPVLGRPACRPFDRKFEAGTSVDVALHISRPSDVREALTARHGDSSGRLVTIALWRLT
jgi:hypothetical protein